MAGYPAPGFGIIAQRGGYGVGIVSYMLPVQFVFV